MPAAETADRTMDPKEVARFERMAAEWWDASGKFRPLHQIGPVRLTFIRDQVCTRLGREPQQDRPLAGLTALDIGCGGGLIAEPVARLGATVTGIDPGELNIGIARRHAAAQGLAIDYQVARAEDLAEAAAMFDVVLSLEVIEHVPEPAAFVATCARLVKPGGLLILSTLNRTLKSFALAIVGAEYVLRWLPRGTHQWDRFVTPEELQLYAEAAGLTVCDARGMVYNLLSDRWSLADDMDVNFLMAMGRAAAS